MDLEIVGITVLWCFLFGYLVIASIDFGAGFFDVYSDWTGENSRIQAVIQRYLSPVWEVTNVFLVFFFVGVVGFFPQAAFYYGTALLVPASISIILIAIRGSYYAFSHYSSENSLYKFLYGITGVFIPASLSIVLILSEGGFIEKSGDIVTLSYTKLLASPFAWCVVVLAVVSVLFISSVFLTNYADKAGDESARSLFRTYALAWAFPSIIAAFLTFIMLKFHNPSHFRDMIGDFPFFVLSAAAFIGAFILIYKQRLFSLAFFFVLLQYFFAFLGYGISHYPYLLYDYLTIYDGFTSPTMATALVIAFIAGLCVLLPSIYLLLRLFIFDRPYVEGRR